MISVVGVPEGFRTRDGERETVFLCNARLCVLKSRSNRCGKENGRPGNDSLVQLYHFCTALLRRAGFCLNFLDFAVVHHAKRVGRQNEGNPPLGRIGPPVTGGPPLLSFASKGENWVLPL